MSPHIIIVGGGIVGLCTAHCFAESLEEQGASITIVDNAPELLLGSPGSVGTHRREHFDGYFGLSAAREIHLPQLGGGPPSIEKLA